MKRKRVDSREVGLEIGLILIKYLIGTEYLHYGYWPEGEEPDVRLMNFGKAQERYADWLLENIPDGTRTILDIGCGTGKFALELVNRGYRVTCVSPKNRLSDYAGELLGGKADVREAFFEAYRDSAKYDLMLFSESYQYIHMKKGFENCLSMLNNNGHILISDFFRRDMPDRGPLGGGHKLREFYPVLGEFPLEIVKDTDITERTAPTLDIIRDFLGEVGKPVLDLVLDLVNRRYPLTSRFLKWKYRKQLSKIDRKYSSGEMNGVNFIRYKSYRTILLKRK